MLCGVHSLENYNETFDKSNSPEIMITILIRNKAYSLPYFLYYLENLDYDKSKIMLWIRIDHTTDDSGIIVSDWVKDVRQLYNNIDYHHDDVTKYYSDEAGFSHDWTSERVNKLIALKEEALNTARRINAKFILFIDADNLITNPLLLNDLLKDKESDIIAPLLNVTTSSFYSNFWCEMDSNLYYKRTPDYLPILNRDDSHIGINKVALVHSTFLIKLQNEKVHQLSFLTKDLNVPKDDIIRLAYNSKKLGLSTCIINDQFYGFMTIPADMSGSQLPRHHELESFRHLLLECVAYDISLRRLPSVLPTSPPPVLGVDKIFVINLKRRHERRKKMEESLKILGLDVEFVDAVDGKTLNNTYIKEIGVEVLRKFRDPYIDRTMKFGEIGCFLSHYNIWKAIKENGYSSVIVFEDDIRFEPHFIEKFQRLREELIDVDHDLVYLGRKAMDKRQEPLVTSHTVRAYYSYWTLGYLLTSRGASVLLDEQPLKKMIPVDEYIPVMFDHHPLDEIKLEFNNRALLALSSHPLLLYPTHYTGEVGHITDTEDSVIKYLEGGKIQTKIQGPPKHTDL